MKKFLKLLFILPLSLVLFFSCSEDEISIENTIQNYGFGLQKVTNKVDESTPVFKLPIFRTIATDQSVVVSYEIDMTALPANNTYLPSDFTFSGSVTIPAGEKVAYADITFVHPNLVLGVERKVTFKILQPDDAGSIENKTAYRSVITYSPLCNFNEVRFLMTQDRYGSETTWNIVKDGNIVASGGPFTDLTTDTTLVLPARTLCLEAGNYTLNVFDAYGDGMVTSATVFGRYSLVRGPSNEVIVSGLGNAFTTSISHPFTLQ
jgi:hypothetical protein